MRGRTPDVLSDPNDLASALRTVGGKWKIRIVCLLLDGTKRFGELRRLLPGVHRGTLSYELRGLEADGIIERTQYMTIPPTVEYNLTAHGIALRRVIIALSQWIQSASATPSSISEKEQR